MRIENILQRLGFSANEVKVYLAILSLEIVSAQNVAKEAGIPRTTAYAVLEALTRRGVVAKTVVRGKIRFTAEAPEKLLALLTEIRAEAERALPELAARYGKSERKPRIVFYEGPDAIQKVYDDTLAERPKEILEWNTDAYFHAHRSRVDSKYIEKRMHLGISAKRIAGAGSGWQEHRPHDPRELSETVIVPKEQFWPDIEVNIYGRKVAFLNYAENMSIIIESKAIADAMRQAYELSWRGAKNLEKSEDVL